MVYEYEVPVTQEEINRQIEWENHCVEEGVRRFRETQSRVIVQRDGQTSLVQKELGDTPQGIIIMRDVVERSIGAITEAQEEAYDLMANAKGRFGSWWFNICLLSPEKLAVITVRSILTLKQKGQTTNGGGSGRTFSSISFSVGASIKAEVEFEKWQEKSKQKAKEEGTKDFVSILLSKYRGTPNRMTFRRWKQKFAEIENLAWTHEDLVQIGAKLAELVIRNSGGWFEMGMVLTRNKTEMRVHLSEDAQTAIQGMVAQLEVNRPFLLPSIIPPKPWSRHEETQTENPTDPA